MPRREIRYPTPSRRLSGVSVPSALTALSPAPDTPPLAGNTFERPVHLMRQRTVETGSIGRPRPGVVVHAFRRHLAARNDAVSRVGDRRRSPGMLALGLQKTMPSFVQPKNLTRAGCRSSCC